MKCSILSLMVGFLVCYGTTSLDLPKEVKLFNEVGLTSMVLLPTGVTKASGQQSNTSSFAFNSQVKDLVASKKGLTDAIRLIGESHDFIVSAYVKVEKGSGFGKNTVVSMNSPDGNTLYFLLAISSDWRTSQLKLEFYFQANTGQLKTIKSNTPRKSDITIWHKISMRVQDSEKLIRFYVDNIMVDVKKFDYKIKAIPSNSQLRLAQAYEIGMEGTPEITNRFQGTLQDVKISLGSGNCNLPTPKPEPCKCPSIGGSGCVMDGRGYKDGQQWDKDKCNVCKCKGRHVFCVHTCPVCREGGKVYLHGESWHPSNDSCMNCKCESGQTKCAPPVCPKLSCNKPGYSGKTIVPKGQCCAICREDHCKASKKVYKPCGCTKTCKNHYRSSPCGGKCTEGCFCPTGQVMTDAGECKSPAQCKCTANGKTYKPGQFYSPDPCKFCICLMGYMHCSKYC